MFKIFCALLLINFFHFSISQSKEYQNCHCGQTGHFVKIVGGQEARPHSYPWLVALVGFPEENNFFCGGSIVSSRYIVTAGHCFRINDKSYNEDNIRLKIGAHDIVNGEYLFIKPKKIKIYERYTEENDISSPMFDIALIELEEDLPVNFKIEPICIHSKYFNYFINDLKEKIDYLDIDLSYKNTKKNPFKNKKKYNKTRSDLLKKKPKVQRIIQETDVRPDLFKNYSVIGSNFETPTDETEIFFDHPNKALKKLVDETVDEYFKSISNDPEKIYDFSQEFNPNKLIVAGWGTTDPYEFKMPDNLMETEVDQRKSEVCENTYGDDVYFRSKNLCANRLGKDACTGDSGGPLVNIQYGRANLYGIVSYGRSCGAYSAPGVYTRVSPFLKWILINTIDSDFCSN